MSAVAAPPQEHTVSLGDDHSPQGQLTFRKPPARLKWTRDKVLAWMVRYIRRHANLPSRTEYFETQDDGPDESTIRLRLGAWKPAWRTALQVILDEAEAPRGQDGHRTCTQPDPEPAQNLQTAVLDGLRGGLRPFELARDLRVPRALILSIRDELRLTLPDPNLGRARRTRKSRPPTALEQSWRQVAWPASALDMTRLIYGQNPTQQELNKTRRRLIPPGLVLAR